MAFLLEDHLEVGMGIEKQASSAPPPQLVMPRGIFSTTPHEPFPGEQPAVPPLKEAASSPTCRQMHPILSLVTNIEFRFRSVNWDF